MEKQLVNRDVPNGGNKSNCSVKKINGIPECVMEMFGSFPADSETCEKMIQISQAEECKTIIERCRISNTRQCNTCRDKPTSCCNELFSTPKESEAANKLTVQFINRSERPVLLAFDESDNSAMTMYAVNGTPNNVTLNYKVRDLMTGIIIALGSVFTPAASSVPAIHLPRMSGEHFLLIMWEQDGKQYTNHFITQKKGISYDYYLSALKTAGYDTF